MVHSTSKCAACQLKISSLYYILFYRGCLAGTNDCYRAMIIICLLLRGLRVCSTLIYFQFLWCKWYITIYMMLVQRDQKYLECLERIMSNFSLYWHESRIILTSILNWKLLPKRWIHVKFHLQPLDIWPFSFFLIDQIIFLMFLCLKTIEFFFLTN